MNGTLLAREYRSLMSVIHGLLPRGPLFFAIAVAVALAVGALAVAFSRAGLWRERFVPPLLALATAFMGLLDLASALGSSSRLAGALAPRLAFLESISPLEVRHGSRLVAALAGFALVALSGALRRRKRAAWAIAVATLSLSAVAQLGKALNYEEAAIALALVALFVSERKSFHARSDEPSVRQGIVSLAGFSVATVLYGIVGFNALAARTGVRLSLERDLRAIRDSIQFVYPSAWLPNVLIDHIFVASVAIVAYSGLAISLFLILRPVLIRRAATGSDRMRASQIVADHGTRALDDFALFEDKAYSFTSGGSLLAYALVGRKAILLGGPIGPDADRAASVHEFASLCRKNDWMPVAYQATAEDLSLYAAEGLTGKMTIGSDATICLAEWSMAGKKAQDFRTAINRLEKAGQRVVVSKPPHPARFVDSLRPTSDEWLTARGGVEQRFALGGFDPRYLDGCAIAAVVGEGGEPTAFVNLVAEGKSGLAVDLMRSGERAMKGTMDALFATVISWAKDAGYATFGLGLSPLGGIGEHPEDPAFERALAKVTPMFERYYGYGGLHGFKEKFSPRWTPRYLVCPNAAALPAALLAVARAHVGGSLVEYAFEVNSVKRAATKTQNARYARLPADTR